MAIQLTSISPIRDYIYSITVQDTSDQTGTDADSNPIYKTYTLKFNSNDSAENLKAKFESLIAENKSIVSQKSSIETILKTTIESIDTSKIG